MVVTGVSGEDVGGGRMRPASTVVARGAQAVTYILNAYCAEFEKENPSESTTFTLQNPDPVVKCLAEQGANLSLPGNRQEFRCLSRICDRSRYPAEARRRSEEHTSELQSLRHLVCRLLL